jgi:hypothetical protein
MCEAIVLPERRVALDDRGVPLGERRGQLRLQRIDVGRGLIRGSAHASKESDLLALGRQISRFDQAFTTPPPALQYRAREGATSPAHR